MLFEIIEHLLKHDIVSSDRPTQVDTIMPKVTEVLESSVTCLTVLRGSVGQSTELCTQFSRPLTNTAVPNESQCSGVGLYGVSLPGHQSMHTWESMFAKLTEFDGSLTPCFNFMTYVDNFYDVDGDCTEFIYKITKIMSGAL